MGIAWIQTQGESFTSMPKLQEFLQCVLEAKVKHKEILYQNFKYL